MYFFLVLDNIFITYFFIDYFTLPSFLSNTIKNDGNTAITTTILTIAPLAIKLHSEPIISIFEYAPTPNVAPKKHNPLTTIEPIDSFKASPTASFKYS